MADTAALVVALSAQLTKFEKDMKNAVGIASKRTKEIENTFGKMNLTIQNQLSALGGGVGGPFGSISTLLRGMGPLGAVAATGILAIASAFAVVNVQVAEYAKKVDRLRNVAETTGLTITQLDELNKAGLDVGVTAEQVEGAIGKMTVSIDQLREGTGPLFERLRRLNPQLLLQVTNAKSTADAIDILAKAFAGLGSEFEKNAFLREVFGRGGLPFGRVLQQVADVGGLKAMEEQSKKTGKAINENIAKEIDDIADQITQIKNRTVNIWGEAFGVDAMNLLKSGAELWERISTAVANAYTNAKKAPPPPPTSLGEMEMGGLPPQFTAEEALRKEGERRMRARQPEILTRLPEMIAEVPMPPVRPAQELNLTLAQQIKILQDRVQVLGDAATAADKYRLEELKLQQAVEAGTITEEDKTIALAKLATSYTTATLALKERLGIITEEELIQKRLNDFYADAASKQLTLADRHRAIAAIIKEAKKDIEEMKIKQSDLPQLARLAKEAQDLKANLDKLAVDTLGNLETALVDVATGTKTLSEAFKAMTDAILKDLIRLLVRQAITGPIAAALGNLFAPGAGGTNIFAGLFNRQQGGPVTAGQPYIVGERGPELFVPKGSGQIVPQKVTGRTAGGGLKVVVNNYTSGETETTQQTRQGPTGEELIIGIVKKTIATGQADGPNRSRFGLRAQKVR